MSGSTKPQSSELRPGPGYRIRKTVSAPSPEIVEQFRQFETPDISDMLNRLYAMTYEIHNQINDASLTGPACTVKVFPGDNLMVHKALDIARPGDVVVVDASGSTMTAVIGDLVATKAKHRKIQGFVIDGLIRDVTAMREVGIPVFARGITPVGPLHRGPGEINYPVSCGGIVVMPGDIIVADACGVVVVRQDFAEDVIKRLYTQREKLEEYLESVQRGDFSNAWVDTLMADTGCVIEE